MSKFRLPRKTKKGFKKDLWFYPYNEKDQVYRVGFPSDNQEDYDAFKNGLLTGALIEIKKRVKK